jgi:hypothetical protein
MPQLVGLIGPGAAPRLIAPSPIYCIPPSSIRVVLLPELARGPRQHANGWSVGLACCWSVRWPGLTQRSAAASLGCVVVHGHLVAGNCKQANASAKCNATFLEF